jgi:hypothetical protein
MKKTLYKIIFYINLPLILVYGLFLILIYLCRSYNDERNYDYSSGMRRLDVEKAYHNMKDFVFGNLYLLPFIVISIIFILIISNYLYGYLTKV